MSTSPNAAGVRAAVTEGVFRAGLLFVLLIFLIVLIVALSKKSSAMGAREEKCSAALISPMPSGLSAAAVESRAAVIRQCAEDLEDEASGLLSRIGDEGRLKELAEQCEAEARRLSDLADIKS